MLQRQQVISINLLTISLFILLSSFFYIIIIPSKVFAEPAKCYVALLGNQSATYCSEATLFLPPGTIVSDDKCYDVIATASGWGVKESSCANPVFAGAGTFTTPPAVVANDLANQIENSERKDVISCGGQNNPGTPQECLERNPIYNIMRVAINFLSAAIGVIVTVVIIWAGIQYSASGGDPGKTAEAKKRIINAIIALISFIFLWAFLQWLVPGSPF